MSHKPTTPVMLPPKVNAPKDSWWCCADEEFSAKLAERLEAMRASKELPAYAPSVAVYHARKRQEL